jgi:hypothetical protein
MRKFCLAWALPGLLLFGTANAGTKDFALQGYALPADKQVTIALMRPDVNVGELAAGGLPQPNADWTQQARDNLEAAFKAQLAKRNLDFRTMESELAARQREATVLAERCAASKDARAAAEKAAATFIPAPVITSAPIAGTATQAGPVPVAAPVLPAVPAECAAPPQLLANEDTVAQYNALHGAVVDAILQHKYGIGGGKLPTKKEDFDYTLGSGTAALGRIAGSNYGLFVQTTDQFASASRKTMQVAGALGCLVGFCMIVSGGVHVAYVSMVDLDTGKIIWFNLVRGSKGDVREAQGANDLAVAILESMPTRPGAMLKAAAK